jgi:hypothetical protein
MFVDKAKSLPQSGPPKRYFTQVSSCLTLKHQTRLERLARDKHSSLLRKIVNYGRKSFIRFAPDDVQKISFIFFDFPLSFGQPSRTTRPRKHLIKLFPLVIYTLE